METYLLKETSNSLSLSLEAFEEMKKHGEEGFPHEICGFMFGDSTDDRKITLVQPIKNAKIGDQRRRFEIDPRDYQKAEIFAALIKR